MSTTTNLGITKLDPGLRQPEVVINNAFDEFDAVIGSFATGVYYNVLDHGLEGDGVTDDTAALQALINLISTAGKDATIFFPAGTYLIAGSLQDTSLSNSQIVLPKISKAAGSMRTLRFLGASPPSQAWPTNTGSILKSTLGTGSGAVIGVRANWGGSTATALLEAQNAMTFLTFVLENMIVRTVANPTISGVDNRFVHRSAIYNSRIDVEGITTGSDTITPDILCTEPTTTTSYGLLTPIGGIPSLAVYSNLTIMGYYNGMRWGELVTANNITFGGLKVGVEFRAGGHASLGQKLLFVTTKELLKASGRDPFITQTSIDTNVVNIQQWDYENSSGLMAWAATTSHLTDPSNYLRGDITWNNSVMGLIRTGGAFVKFHNTEKPWHRTFPYTPFLAGDIEAAGPAISEVYRGQAGGVAWQLLTAKQTGTTDVIGILAYVNDQIADGNDKRLAQVVGRADGAINHGALEFYVSSGGTLTLRAWIDHSGNFCVPYLMSRGVGSDIASANTIAPTFPVHVVTGTGLLKTITVPTLPTGGSVTIALIPTGAWTYDATGNIAGAGGTAVVGRTMFATWVPALSKWSMSY